MLKNRKGLLVSSACAESELQKGHKSVAWEMENFQHDWGRLYQARRDLKKGDSRVVMALHVMIRELASGGSTNL